MLLLLVVVALVVLRLVEPPLLLLPDAQDSTLAMVDPKLAIGKKTQEEDKSTTVYLVLSVNVQVSENRIQKDIDDDGGGGGSLEILNIVVAKCAIGPNVELVDSHIADSDGDDTVDGEADGNDQETGPRIAIRIVALGYRVTVQHSAGMAGTRYALRCVWM